MKKIIFCSDKAYVVDFAALTDETCCQVAQATAEASGIPMENLILRSVKEQDSGKELLNFYGEGTLVNSTLPGKVVKLCFEDGAAAKAGDTLILLESMKMENEIKAPKEGVVHYLVPENITVKQGEALFLLQ